MRSFRLLPCFSLQITDSSPDVTAFAIIRISETDRTFLLLQTSGLANLNFCKHPISELYLSAFANIQISKPELYLLTIFRNCESDLFSFANIRISEPGLSAFANIQISEPDVSTLANIRISEP
jgi:hypothetical protein